MGRSEIRDSDPGLYELRDDLNDTRAQLAEMQERLDFAERLLTSGRHRKRTEMSDRLLARSGWQTSAERPSGVRDFP